MRVWSHWFVVAGVGLAGLGACSGPEISDSTTTRLITPAPTDAPTSSTTGTPKTGLPTTTVPIGPVEAAVRQVHTRFMTELFTIDARVVGPEARLPLAEELTTGRQLKRIRESVVNDLDSGERLVGPGFDSHIVLVVITGDKAEVVDCSQGRGEGYSADGQLLVPADDFYKLRWTELVLIDGTWFVEDFLTGGDNRCDPSVASLG